MDVTDDPSHEQVVKRATTPDERRRLAREARALRTVAHPGVVRLVGTEGDDPPTALLLERVHGSPLRRHPNPSVLALGAGVATTLADLHDIGWAHTAIRPEHVLVGSGDQTVLCGFGSCVRVAPGSREQRRDVADLAAVLLDLLPAAGSQRWRRRLRRVRDSGRCDARRLARMLSADRGPRRRRRRPLIAAALAAAGLIGLAVSQLAVAHHSPACPAADRGCRPVQGVAGPDRLMLAYPAVVVMGRWRCRSEAYPAVLNLRTGAVWMFAQWPGPGHRETARLVEQIAGAVSLSVQPGASGCDRLVVRRGGGS
jgi:hypothetical protein